MKTTTTGVTKPQMVRVSARTHRAVQELAERRGQSMTRVIEEAIERERREPVLRDANAAWARIMDDPQAKAEIETERALWDATLGDGLELEDWSDDADAAAR